MLALLLSALSLAAAAGLAPVVLHPWPVADATAFAFAALALVMGVEASRSSRRKDPS